MEKEQIIIVVEEAIESLKKGTWTFPGITIAFLTALKYIIEKQ